MHPLQSCSLSVTRQGVIRSYAATDGRAQCRSAPVKSVQLTASVLALAAVSAMPAMARDQIQVTGFSTVQL